MFEYISQCAQEVLANICQILIQCLFHEDKLVVKLYYHDLQLNDLVQYLGLKIQTFCDIRTSPLLFGDQNFTEHSDITLRNRLSFWIFENEDENITRESPSS